MAHVDFGTNHPDHTYSAAPAPPAHASLQPPYTLDANGRLTACGLSGALAAVPCTCYSYDAAGRQEYFWSADGTVTRSEYDGLGRLVLTLEDATDRDADGNYSITAYRYDDSGRLIAMAGVHPAHFASLAAATYANINWNATSDDKTIQVTRFSYADGSGGAPVMSATWRMETDGGRHWLPQTGTPGAPQPWSAYSGHRGWIARVDYPDGDFLAFTYYSDGAVATRTAGTSVGGIDELFSAFYYSYDGQGRRTDTWIDDAYYYATPTAHEPVGRIARVHYHYEPSGRLAGTAAYEFGGALLTNGTFTYDSRGNLLSETQSIGSAAPRVVGYEWEYLPSDMVNADKLRRIDYPSRPQGGSVSLSLAYGASPTSVDAALARITALRDVSTGYQYGGFEYIGAGRRVRSTRADGTVLQELGSANTYTGLDAWGRIRDLHYRDATATPLHRYQYGYDAAGNRLFARVTQSYLWWSDYDNGRSYRYTYDALGQLLSAELGRLDPTNSHIVSDPGVRLRRTNQWSLDSLGNWAGAGAVAGLARADYLDGSQSPAHTFAVWHEPNVSNQLDAVSTVWDGGTAVDSGLVHDAAGNVVLLPVTTANGGALLFLQYDGFSRLVQVNLGCDGPDCLGPEHFDASGRLIAGDPAAPVGRLLARYGYDGIGRLVRAERYDSAHGAQAELYYYDGVRRIQEVSATVVPGSGGPVTTFAVREYVWGPEYVDEIIAQVATNPLLPAAPPMMTAYLTDANYNVTGLVGDLNDGGGQGVEPLTVKQYTWDPYGAVVLTEDHDTVAIPFNRLGHQGLCFERFCVDPDERITDDPLAGERFATGTGGVPAGTRRPTVGLYYARNRWYSPDLGRFVTRDPNATAAPIVTATPLLDIPSISPQSHYGNGANLYQFAGANPVMGRDPLGLFDYFGEVDDIVWELQAERALALAEGKRFWIGMAEQAAIAAVQEAIVYATGGIGILVVGAWNAAEAGLDIYENGLSWANGAQLAFGAAPWARLGVGKALQGIGAAANSLQAHRGRFKQGAFSLLNVQRVPRSSIAKAPSLRGNAPIGIDGKPIEIHHVNQNPQGPYMEVLSSEHRRLKTRRPGLTTEERRLFELAKIRYWERQWDLGRFTDLPG
ncbi:MAG: hypothetical protein IPM18_17005 [Phycisphaerales bacterium]|nr:hypothetical protein [Phycisphaerales bacterium]